MSERDEKRMGEDDMKESYLHSENFFMTLMTLSNILEVRSKQSTRKKNDKIFFVSFKICSCENMKYILLWMLREMCKAL